MAKVFRDYAEVIESMMEGFTVTKVSTGINTEDSGMMLELERQIDNVTIGISPGSKRTANAIHSMNKPQRSLHQRLSCRIIQAEIGATA